MRRSSETGTLRGVVGTCRALAPMPRSPPPYSYSHSHSHSLLLRPCLVAASPSTSPYPSPSPSPSIVIGPDVHTILSCHLIILSPSHLPISASPSQYLRLSASPPL